MQLPGAFWVALLLGIIPVVQSVLSQFFPDSQYWWSALLVGSLAALAKAVQVQATKPPVVDAPPGAAGAPLVSAESQKVKSFLFG